MGCILLFCVVVFVLQINRLIMFVLFLTTVDQHVTLHNRRLGNFDSQGDFDHIST